MGPFEAVLHRPRYSAKLGAFTKALRRSGPVVVFDGQILSKAIVGKPPEGFQAIPGGKHGGYRKKVGAKWVYWYPTAEAAAGAQKYHAKQEKVAQKKLGRLLRKRGATQEDIESHLEAYSGHGEHAEGSVAGAGEKVLAEHKAKQAKVRAPDKEPEPKKDEAAPPEKAEEKPTKEQTERVRTAEKQLGVDKHREAVQQLAQELAGMQGDWVKQWQQSRGTGPKADKATEKLEEIEEQQSQAVARFRQVYRMMRQMEQEAERHGGRKAGTKAETTPEK
jgi:hypothetical protein